MARGLQRAWMRGISSSMNWHEVMDECALEMDRVIARELRADPAKLDLAVAWIQRFLDDADYSDQNKDALAEWMEILRQGFRACWRRWRMKATKGSGCARAVRLPC